VSIEAVARALTIPGPTASERLALIGIANHDGDGGAWPSIATLAHYACVSERQIRATLRRLETKGWIGIEYNAGGTSTTRADRRPNRYTINWTVIHTRGEPDCRSQRSRGEVERHHGGKSASPEPSYNHPPVTSETLFTRVELDRAFDEQRRQHPRWRQTVIDRTRADRLVALRPQPPLEVCVAALLGEEHSLGYWMAEHPS